MARPSSTCCPWATRCGLQIIAKGFQTYGDDFKIDKTEMAIDIRMKRPGEQYSIYKPQSEKKETGRAAYDAGNCIGYAANPGPRSGEDKPPIQL
jgi:hypothetical protein